MEKKLAVVVVGEIREAAAELISLIAEAEVAMVGGDKKVMEKALGRVIKSKTSVLLRLAAVAGMVEGKLANRGLLAKILDKVKGQ